MQSVKAGAKLDPETQEDLSNVEKVLRRYNITLRDSTMEFRPLGDVIDEVAQRWTTLTNVEQSQITMALAGVRQREKLTTLMENYSMALGFQAKEAESAGSSVQKYGIYLDNIEASQNRATASFEKFAAASFGEKQQIAMNNFLAGLGNLGAAIGGLGPIVLSVISIILIFKGALATTWVSAAANAFLGLIGTLSAVISLIASGTPLTIALAAAFGTLKLSIGGVIGIITLIGTIGYMIFTGLSNNVEKSADKVKRLATEVSDLESELSKLAQNQKVLGTIGDEFESLRLNTRRTNEEELRFIELQNKIKDIVPDVSGDYNTQGDFILHVSENLEKLNEAQREEIENIEKKKKLKAEEGFGSQIDVYKNALSDFNSAKQLLNQYSSEKENPGLFGFNDEAALQQARTDYELKNQVLKEFVANIKKNFMQMGEDSQKFYLNDLDMRGKWGKDLANQLRMIQQASEDARIQGIGNYQRDQSVPAQIKIPPFNLEETKKSFDELMGLLKSVPDQAREMNDTFKETGKITNEQVESLRSAFGDDYVKAITVTADGIKLNVEGLHELIMAKADDAVFTAQQIWLADETNELLKIQFDRVQALHDELGKRDYLNTLVDQKKAQEEILKLTIEMIKQQKNAEKDALQHSIDDYKEMIDAKKKALEDAAESEKEAIQDQLDNYKKIIDAEIDLLDQKKRTDEYNDELASRNKEISDIDAQLLALQFDNSESAKAKRLQLEADKVKKVKDLTKYQNDYAVDNQKSALEKEYQNYEESMKRRQTIIERNLKSQKDALDQEYKDFESSVKDKILLIDNYLKESGRITIDAMNMLGNKTSEFYNKLLEWNRKFGDGVDTNIIAKLEEAFGLMMMLNAYNSGGGGGGSNRPTQELLDQERNYGIDLNGDGKIGYYHDGGSVGVPKLKDNEQFGVLLEGERVDTPSQIQQFMNKTLPMIAKFGGGGDTSIELNVNVAGNLDKSCLPDLKETIMKTINEALMNRGTKRGAFSYSV